ncbi:hypothetical protein GCM10007385_02050 [Tateyamaria omphalii]|uniref:hypothetical protein n=1 Tax=Tateyamaria omphalii TaxID=299262 RepID=UPI001671ECFA|nr:hypothetical protein [Tateyamaria omphalii]GGX38776.1 hypothetical protein GCM10007385_02050 [Tateyamaria omphalii]
MTKAFKLISTAAVLAATSTVALAQGVPLNTTVSGGQGAEIQAGQGEAGAIALTPVATAGLLAATLAIAAGDSSSSSTTDN